MPAVRDTDVLVVGAGPAGCAAAITLAVAGARVVMAAETTVTKRRIGEALPPDVMPSLHSLGVATSFADAGFEQSPALESCWGDANARSRDFIFSPYGPGWHVVRDRFDRLFLERARAVGVRVVDGIGPRTIRRAGGAGWSGMDRQGAVVQATFLIDASGRGAVSGRIGLASYRTKDRLVARQGLWQLPTSRVLTTTLVEACEDGWWYSSPLPNGLLAVTELTDGDLRSQREAARPGTPPPVTRARLDRAIQVEPPRVYPASTKHAQVCVGGDWLLAGDAAQTIDPLSGQGIASALRWGIIGGGTASAHLRGQAIALVAYQAALRTARASSEAMRLQTYGREQRWPTSEFWRRRHSAGVQIVARSEGNSIGTPRESTESTRASSGWRS